MIRVEIIDSFQHLIGYIKTLPPTNNQEFLNLVTQSGLGSCKVKDLLELNIDDVVMIFNDLDKVMEAI